MPSIALVTHPEAKVKEFAHALVEKRLAACVNVLPGVQSIYHWEGKVESSMECLLIVKTENARLAELEQAVIELHPYEVPEFIVIEADGISAAYQRWLTESVSV